MSASKDRIQRKQQIEAGTDKRSVAAAKAEKERRQTTIRYSIVAAVLVVVFAFVFIYNSALPAKLSTGVTIDGEKYSVAELNYYYSSTYMNFYNNYYTYLSYGLFFDTSLSLSTQEYSEGVTWRDYFIDSAIDSMTEIQILNNAAAAAGYVLPEEYQTQYEETLESIRTNWKDLGYSSLKQYLSMNYGKGVTMQIVEEQLYRTYVASAYSQEVFDGYEYTAAELAAYHTEHADETDVIDYTYYAVYDGDEIDADALVSAIDGTSEEEFVSYMEENYEGAVPTTLSYAGSDLNELYAEWLLDASRAEGDAAAFTDEDGDVTYVVMFLSRDDGDYKMTSFRHILINAADEDGDGVYSEEEIAAAEAKAEDIYAEWKSGGATEDSFAELANTYSEDGGSNTTGGLYENVYKGQMVSAIDEWLFDEERAEGDTTIVTNDGSYTGAHVVYFVGHSDLTYAAYEADQALRNEAYSTWIEESRDAIEVVRGSVKLAGQNH